jgi:uncharacterized protein YbcC (UPF0753/DUF2309 family)
MANGRAGPPPAARHRRVDDRRAARDWAEVRPEWALAGCKAFIAAPRGGPPGGSLEGRAFLHDYDWQQEQERFRRARAHPHRARRRRQLDQPAILRLDRGAGQSSAQATSSCTTSTGGIGVVEGNGGTLRAGLPWQSVHDGEAWSTSHCGYRSASRPRARR